ncbi:MAG TPA: oligosaccharide flippase family protein, partial [Saprospiraceae bacterium]|nr:oligosaccharide flippase family protein [Saprospiraceae bacterium]
MSLLKKLAGETALYGLSSIVGRMLNFFLTFIYARTLTTAENGVLNELYAYAGFLIVVFSYRMESAFFRYGTPVEDRERSYATGLFSIIGSTIGITIGLLVFAQPLADLLHYSDHAEYIRWFALILAFDCLSELPFARLRLEQRPRRFVAGKLLNIGVNIFLNVFWLIFCPWAARHGLDWVHYVWSPTMGVSAVFLANLIASVVTIVYLLPQMSGLKAGFDTVLWRKMILYAAPLIIVQFAGIVNQMLDRALLKWLLPGTPEENLSQVGIYGNNYKLAMLITIFTQAYRYAAEPFFFRHAGDANAPDIQAKATKWFTIAATTGMAGVLLFLDLVKYFLGEKYFSGLKVVPILLLANVLLGIYYNLSVWYRLKDKTMLGAWISIGGALLTLFLNILLVPRIGYVGAAWTALATYFFMCLATWITGQKHYPVPYQFGRMGLYIAVALVLFAVSQWLGTALSALPVLLWTIRTALFGGFLGLIYLLEMKEL